MTSFYVYYPEISGITLGETYTFSFWAKAERPFYLEAKLTNNAVAGIEPVEGYPEAYNPTPAYVFLFF